MKRLRLFMIFALLCMVAQGAWAQTGITELKLIGGDESTVNSLKTTYENQGWTVINYDLNKNAGGDFIYLLYKTGESDYVTGLYLRTGGDRPDNFTAGGHTYNIVPVDGASNFQNNKGDLNSNAGGEDINLYYTTDAFTPNRYITAITFNETRPGGLDANGDCIGHDLNYGAGGDYIFLHLTYGGAEGTISVTTEGELQDAVRYNSATVQLNADIAEGQALLIESGHTISLDLNGKTLSRSLSESSDYGMIVWVRQGGKLTIQDGADGGQIKGGNSTNGGGIANNGTLYFEGGIISSCQASNCGGGIYNGPEYSGADAAKLYMKGGVISGCYGKDAGGVYNYSGSDIDITGGTISGCSSEGGGGGVVNYGTAIITGGSINNNHALSRGGGVWNGGSATLTISGGSITGNRADTNGGGIFSYSTFRMSGNPTITGNENGNLYLNGGSTKINTGTFTSGASIGITLSNYDRVFTNDYEKNNPGTYANTYFSTDVEGAAFSLQGTEGSREAHLSSNGGVTYVERSWTGGDTDGHVLSTQKLCTVATTYNSNTNDNTLNGGWYVLSGTFTFNNRVTINGDANFILQDGCNVEFDKGIYIPKDKTLTIYGQNGDSGYLWTDGSDGENGSIGGNEGTTGGHLVIHGGKIYAKPGSNNAAGIGGGEGNGSNNTGMQSVTIYGGTVEAYGKSSGAGIGCGEMNDNPPEVTIYGGTITTKGGKYGAGIGGSEECGNGTIKIYGGTVTAKGGKQGAGIGSGSRADVGNSIKIYGGTVTATGGKYAAGIGGGEGGNNSSTIEIRGGTIKATGGEYGAGIGGGESVFPSSGGGGTAREFNFDPDDDVAKAALTRAQLVGGIGGKIYIYDGYIEVYGGEAAACIGDGSETTVSNSTKIYIYGGTIKAKIDNYDDDHCNAYIGYAKSATSYDDPLSLDDKLCVSKGNTKVTSGQRKSTCMSHPSDDSVILTITSCDHSGRSYSIKNDSQHKLNCSYCSAGSTENHNTDGENGSCSLCGYGSGSYTLSFYEANATANGYGDATEYTMGKGVTFKLPECSNVPDKMVFAGWKKVTSSESAPTSIEADDSELSSLKAAGTSITISESMDGDRYYARYQTCWEGDGTGALDDPYQVKTVSDWNYIANKVSGGNINYSGKYFKMTDNIGTTESPVYNFIGTSSTKFAGNFNGGRKTLTVSYTFVHDYCAPFRYVNGAAIMNLRVDGTLTTSAKHAGGVIGYAEGTNTINNCRVHATVNNTKGSDGSTGGFVGYNNGTVNFTRCIFDGTLSGSTTTGWGGYVGWNAGGAKVNITNCLFKPDANSDAKDGCTFARCQTESDMTITNSYYTQVLGTAQGTQAYTVESYDSDKMWLYYGQLETDEEDEAIAALEYRENEVFVFDTGLLFQKIFYTGGTTAVTFTPIATMEGQHVSGVSASTGTPTENGDGSYTLTMDNDNVTITATGFSNYESLTLYDASANTATLEANVGQTKNVTISGRTLYKDNSWNTLCLPFNVSETRLSAITNFQNYIIKELDVDGWYDSEGVRHNEKADGRHQTGFSSGTLYLYFKTATEIEARKPYLIKWESGESLFEPQFPACVIDDSDPNQIHSNDGKISFVGNYDPVTLTAGDNTKLYLGAANKLYYPSKERNINAFRAYFQLNGIEAGDVTNGARIFFGEDDYATGIISNKDYKDYMDKAGAGWYDLSGRKLSGRPTRKGLYIYNGKKRVIK